MDSKVKKTNLAVDSNRNSRVGKRSLAWTPKSISRVRQDIKSWNTALNLARLAEDPQNWQLQLLYDEVALDAIVTSQINNRQNQVFSSGFSLTRPNGEIDKEQTAVLSNSSLYRFLTKVVLDTIYYGYNVVELSQKQINNKLVLVPELIPRYNIVPQTGRFYRDYADTQNPINYRELPEFGTWILEFNSRDIGLLNKVISHVLFKRFAQACWSELCEIYGIPPRVMKTNTQDATMLNRAETMMKDMGAASWFIIDETEEFEFAKGVATNGDVYNNLIALCRDEICLAISGGLIGQDTQNGSRSKDQVSFEMLWLLVQSDMAMVQEAWNTTIIPVLVKHGILKGELVFAYDQAEDIDQLWKFVTGIMPYYDIDVDWLKDKFGIEITGERQGGALPPGGDPETLRIGDRFFPLAPALTGAERTGYGSHHIHSLNLGLPKEAVKSNRLIRTIADQEGRLNFYPETFYEISRVLIKGFNKGLGKRDRKIRLNFHNEQLEIPAMMQLDLGVDIAYGIDDPHLLTAFELNLWRFSAGKTLAEVQALNELFRKVKSFDEFKRQAQQMADVFNVGWLETEYNTAVLTSESTVNYYNLLRDVDVFPYWQYKTALDNAVRPAHAKLEGLILPASDPYWKRIYPPNDWNCRCYVVARTRGEVQGVSLDEMRGKVNEYFGSPDFERLAANGFGVNRALTGEVFTANQQYITGKNLTQTYKMLNSLGPGDFGMLTYNQAKALAKIDAPVFEGSPQVWLTSQPGLNNKPVIYDYNQRALNLEPGNFEIHTTGLHENRSGLLDAMRQTISSPDEVWIMGASATKKMDDVVYLKYFKDRTVVAIGSLSNGNVFELSTWFELAEKEEVIKKFRRGLLIKGK